MKWSVKDPGALGEKGPTLVCLPARMYMWIYLSAHFRLTYLCICTICKR